MNAWMIVYLALPVVIGVWHGLAVYGRETRQSLWPNRPRRRFRALYHALWAVILWILLGWVVVALWLVATLLYLVTGAFAKKGFDRHHDASMTLEGTETSSYENVKSVGIIGAGLSGLISAKTLLAQGVECTIFERREKLGGVWTIGYANFGVQVAKELYEIPDYPLPPEVPDFTPGPRFQQYLAHYAEHFKVLPHIRFETEVLEVSEREGRPGRVVRYREGGEEKTAEFDLVVIAMGMFSHQPVRPVFPGQDEFPGSILHNSEFQTTEQISGKKVAVVGYGKSGTDAALEAQGAASRVSIIARNPRWPVARKVAGFLPVKWVVLHRLATALLPLYQRPTGAEKVLHSLGKPLVWMFWRFAELLFRIQFRLSGRFGQGDSLVPSLPIERSLFDHNTMLPRPEVHRLIRMGAIEAYRGEVERYTASGLKLKDGREVEADLVILATGWKTDYGFLGAAANERLGLEYDGLYLYRHMICPDLPHMVFLGGNCTSYETTMTVAVQSRWFAALIDGQHKLPSQAAMGEEIETMKVWKRSFMPDSPTRGATIGLHQLHYHDELLEDIGANPMRKRGIFAPLKEVFGPYENRDYAAIASGAWEQEAPQTNT